MYNQYSSIFRMHMRQNRTPFLVIIISMCISQLLLLYKTMLEGVSTSMYGYDLAIQKSHWAPIFYSGLIAISVILLILPMLHNTSSQSYYTYYRLPITRGKQFLIHLGYNCIMVLIFICIEIFLVAAGYYLIYLSMIPESLHLHNGLFLAFRRSEFLIKLLPITSILGMSFYLYSYVVLGVTITYMTFIWIRGHKTYIVGVVSFVCFIYVMSVEYLTKPTIGAYVILSVLWIGIMQARIRTYLPQDVG